jgi:hypothetical protein
MEVYWLRRRKLLLWPMYARNSTFAEKLSFLSLALSRICLDLSVLIALSAPIYFQLEEVSRWRWILGFRSWVCTIWCFPLIIGRAPIDPNFVLAIEKNHQNATNLEAEDGEGRAQLNSEATTIVDEYQQLALYDIFKGIVSNIIDGVSSKSDINA